MELLCVLHTRTCTWLRPKSRIDVEGALWFDTIGDTTGMWLSCHVHCVHVALRVQVAMHKHQHASMHPGFVTLPMAHYGRLERFLILYIMDT